MPYLVCRRCHCLGLDLCGLANMLYNDIHGFSSRCHTRVKLENCFQSHNMRANIIKVICIEPQCPIVDQRIQACCRANNLWEVLGFYFNDRVNSGSAERRINRWLCCSVSCGRKLLQILNATESRDSYRCECCWQGHSRSETRIWWFPCYRNVENNLSCGHQRIIYKFGHKSNWEYLTSEARICRRDWDCS